MHFLSLKIESISFTASTASRFICISLSQTLSIYISYYYLESTCCALEGRASKGLFYNSKGLEELMMMMMMRRRLACCAHNRNISLDFDEQEKIMTYNGLENCIMNQYDNESRSRRDECATDSLDDDDSSCSSSKDGFGSFSSKWFAMKRDERGLEEWELSDSPQRFYAKDKKENPSYGILFSDVDAMKEKFAKLLLGEDVTGGCKGVRSALALSNSITNVAATVFGELWKLEPLPEERKSKWRREMDWFLSPTKYMVELVPTKQNGANGRMIEIMTPKARADIHINLPALQKLDSLLIETLDSMVSTEFWYAEGGKSTHQSKRWWLPIPQVPEAGLSDSARKKLLNQGLLVHQVFKAARSINESVLLDMPVPTIIRDALPKSGKANLNEELYKILTKRSSSTEEVLKLLDIKSEHDALYVINRLEAAAFSWKERITENASGKSPIRTSWSSFVKDPIAELDRAELLSERAEFLVQQLKTRFPNLPQTFLDATKVQYGKDVGHSILEAYSRVLGNLAFTILSRIGDILREDALSDSSSVVSTCLFPGIYSTKIMETPKAGLHEPVNQKNSFDSRRCDSNSSITTDLEFSCNGKASPVTATPSRGRVWCIGKEACVIASAKNSP